ncbi:hypothetical protein HLH33_09905 [Gluconacetobacter diazotrophicus]|uniref:Uncharacterized protein n=1 Tax=Gluconacetobacter diazotrophicus TaxID=33996 RepID=A0A7W4I4X6_GLUDI|nr:hypothetical protein [Gluconacetobacter diazotrophicus]MBB2156618.1 hypothetical protein [Gluconacetobacter diazotrophicus]
MGASATYFGVVIALFFALIAGERVLLTRIAPPSHNGPDAIATAWLAYKAAVQSYVSNHPGFSGSVTADALMLDGSDLSLAQGQNDVRITSNGTVITVWSLANGETLISAIDGVIGEVATIGLSTGTGWTTQLAGTMGNLAVTVPAGDVVSQVTYQGTGFEP